MVFKNQEPAYPFISRRRLPEVQSVLWADPAAEDPGWFTTSMIPEAVNHCAAVMAANLALYLDLRSGTAPDRSLLHSIYRFIGNGPVVRGAFKAASALRQEGRHVRAFPCLTRRHIASALKRGMPCALLLCGSLKDWHWVLCIGMLKAAEREYFAVADGWNRETRFLRCGRGSRLFTAAGFAPSPSG